MTDQSGARKDDGLGKVDPETLTLRARPRPVTRINRRVLMVMVGGGVLIVFGATIFALDPPNFRGDGPGEELYNVRNKPKPEGLAQLPSRYSDLPPELGPPLPGDLGSAVVGMETELGIAPPHQETVPELPFRPNPEGDAMRAERIRLARLAQQGRESVVFFQISGKLTSEPSRSDPSVSGGLDGQESATVDGARGDRQALDLVDDQNRQGRKLAFLEQEAGGKIYNPHGMQSPISPYQVMAGTIIAASLVTGINSDLPGFVIAQVTENVYDTVTGGHLLIPQGTRLLGRYDSVIAFGQERALVVWARIVMPDGSSVVIENWPATDTAGYAGLEDEVDLHTWRLIKGIVLSTFLGVGSEFTLGDEESDLVRAIRESTQDSANQVGQRVTDRNLNIQPTITIRPGWPVRVIVNRDLILRPYQE